MALRLIKYNFFSTKRILKKLQLIFLKIFVILLVELTNTSPHFFFFIIIPFHFL